MGKHEGSAHPSGLIPNGLLPDEGASVIQVLDSNRWTKAEERTAELIACIQPNQPSEERRNAVANYVQRLIMKCFPCQVFTFGSVPLKTYLPDGDIDLTAFSNNQILSDTWANQVRDMLKDEEKNESAEFRVKEVQYIQAEVKIIKCLVENIVVDISFNQLGGLCTLCFLEEVDNLIKQNHLFKRSIILIKAWCYYESRILGAHHGLISTYALETLVLYIFHVFNNSFAGPLEVLYRFLEFFSKFDWDSFCVSLWGPVPISSLPDVAAEPPRKDDGEMRLSKLVYDCSSMYAVSPGGQDNHGQPFISKHFNVIDPLRTNNNLGRSVSKGNFYRIRSAFSFGAKRLARVLDCPKDNVFYEVNQFFVNTWERHGSGHRPDAPSADILRMTVSHPNQLHGSENLRNSVVSKKINDFSGCQAEVGEPRCLHSSSSPHVSNSLESMSKAHAVSNVSRHQKKSYNNLNSSAVSDQKIKRPSNAIQMAHDDKGDKTSKPSILTSELQGRFIFSRTRSSPELTEAYSKVPFRGGRERAAESGKNQINSAKLDNSRRKNVTPQTLTNQNNRPSVVDSSSASHTLSPQSIDAAIKSNTASNSYHDESKLGVMGEDAISSVRMHHGDQETVNMMAPMVQGFNEQVHMPLNLAPAHLPLPISPTVLASMGYVQRNLPGIVQANVPLSEHPWAANMQFSQGVLSPSVAHYFPGVRFPSNPVDVKASNDKFGSVEMNGEVADSDFWHEQDRASTGGDDLDDESFEMFQAEYRQQVALSGHNFSSPTDGSGTSVGVQQRHSKDCMDGFQYQDRRGNEICLEERSVGSEFAAASHSSSVRSKTSSEGSWDGSSTKVLKSTTEKQGKRTTSSSMSSTYGKVKDMSEFEYSQVDSDHRDWNSPSILASEVAERSGGPQFVSSHDSRNHIGFEVPQESASDSLMPIAPMLIGPSSRSRALDNSGAVPFAFYPTGPPVPFLTMLPVYNFPSDPGTPDTLKRHFTEEEALDNSDSGQNFDSSDGINQSHVSITNSTRRDSLAEPNEELKSDILNSDFTSHWQNLQYGRFCQGPRYHGPFVYPSPIMVPPVCLQGRFPMDCPGRPISTNINLLTQLMNYGPRLFPVPSFQHVSHRPTGVHQRYVDEIPRYRSGTGTYLPNPVPVRDKHSSGSRKGSYGHDRNDHVSDREGNWNISRTQVAGRSHNRSQPDRPGIERLAASEGRAERCWSLHKSDPLSTSQPQIGPFCSNVTQAGSANVAYGMYPVPPMNQDGVTSNGPTVPSVVMFYPIDQNANYGSPAEQLEFGSLGPVGFSSTSNASFPTEGNKSGGALEEHRRRSSISRSSLDQPSSNHSQRRL